MPDLTGRIERITYSNDKTGYTVAKIRTHRQRPLVSVIGDMAALKPGETVELQGEWVVHPRFGRQFKATSYKTVSPKTVNGIKRYLGSGLIRGVGPATAGRIVDKFGEDSLEIIENQIEKLKEVEGIGQKRIQMIAAAWEEQKDIRKVMLFLQTYGVTTGYATKIYKRYGSSSILILKQNPYQVATDVPGIGFLTADRIAGSLGLSKKSPERIYAGLLYMMGQFAEEGHVYYPYGLLVSECLKMLGVDREMIESAIDDVRISNKIVIENLEPLSSKPKKNDQAVFLTHHYIYETGISLRLKKLMKSTKSIREIRGEGALSWVQKQMDIILAEKQTRALRAAVQNKVLIITGGPGTGKTTIINALLKIFTRLKIRTLLAAPTGRAAKRMSETSGHEAKTIHRLLEFSPNEGGFQRTVNRPLRCDLLIIDEASMIDTALMYHLLNAVPDHTTMILVGDVFQLPSVGPGNVLKDMIGSGSIPVVELNEIFRQARKSSIVVNAHRINRGEMVSEETDGFTKDFYFIEQEDPEKALTIIIEMVSSRIPKRFGLDPTRDIQVLTPMHRGIIGADNLNLKLQQALNPGKAETLSGPGQFRANDKVMQIKNNYDKDVFNGDIGTIISYNPVQQEAEILFEKRRLLYDFSELDEVALAYAVTVHKSQGSEYPAVVIPILTQHYVLLQRNLIYTAMTRGKKLVVMVGTKKALAIGIKNDKTRKRYTRLSKRLA